MKRGDDGGQLRFVNNHFTRARVSRGIARTRGNAEKRERERVRERKREREGEMERQTNERRENERERREGEKKREKGEATPCYSGYIRGNIAHRNAR